MLEIQNGSYTAPSPFTQDYGHIFGADGSRLMFAPQDGKCREESDALRLEMTRWVCAAMNACAGCSREQLEAVGSGALLDFAAKARKAVELQAEVDNLVTALQRLERECSAACANKDGSFIPGAAISREIPQAREAIAKAVKA